MTSAEVDAVLSDPSLPNEPQALGAAYSGSRPYVAPAQARERRAAMSAALAQGASRDAIVATFTAKYGMTEFAVHELRREVAALWAEEDQEAIKLSRGAARRRLLGHIHSAGKDRKWTAVAALEKVLSEVEGTIAPEPAEQNQDETAALMAVVMEQLALTDPAQIRILIDRERIAIETSAGDRPSLAPKSILSGLMPTNE